ncbi:MAG: hypothetical protein JWR05_1150 [Mucilaginibacter sp.]|nr:hypothetical protein [Mucilaginibacter sp.]
MRKHKEFIITKDGDYLQPEYDENGNPRRVILLKSNKAKIYAAYILINKDLDLVLSALSSLNESDPLIIQQSISFFAIINYAKCFVRNNGRGTSLNTETVFKHADILIKNTHKNNIDLRMDYVAHAGNLFEKCAVTATLYYNNSEVDSSTDLYGLRIGANLLYLKALDDNSVVDFVSLCNFVKAHVETRLKALENQLQEETWELGENELFTKSFLPID